MRGMSPYLLFDGRCKIAMHRYHSVFGGELTVTTIAETEMAAQFPESLHHLAINAALSTPEFTIRAADWLEKEPPYTAMQGARICVDVSTFAEGDRVFTGLLADGGVAREAFAPSPFSAGYGRLTDSFGTRWMVLVGE